MYHIVIGSIILSVVHAVIPNHWLPLLTVGKAENWSTSKILGATFIVGMAHILSTVALGIIIGISGQEIVRPFRQFAPVIASVILISLGLVYVLQKRPSGRHASNAINKWNGWPAGTLIPLIIAMFFSPCFELSTYYFTASVYGWSGILAISLVYLVITVNGMMLLVYLGLKGLEQIKWHFLTNYEKRINGIILIIMGILTYFIER